MPRNPADRPVTEPRTEAGREMLANLEPRWRNLPWDPVSVEMTRQEILAIEAEAAQGAAPPNHVVVERLDRPGNRANLEGPTDEERLAFKRSEREAAAAIMAGDRFCPDPSAHGGAAPPAEGHHNHDGCNPYDEDHIAGKSGAAPRAEGLPPEAIEWARQLVEQGYRDEHIVTFTEDGYGLEHPIACRPNLTGCMFNEWLRTQMAPDREPGRYIFDWYDGPHYTPLASRPSDERVPESEEPR